MYIQKENSPRETSGGGDAMGRGPHGGLGPNGFYLEIAQMSVISTGEVKGFGPSTRKSEPQPAQKGSECLGILIQSSLNSSLPLSSEPKTASSFHFLPRDAVTSSTLLID